MKLKIDDNIKNLIKIFNESNYDCYIVGGFIRDALLNIQSDDYDLCSNAAPAEIIKILEDNNISYNDKFKKFGSIHVNFNNIDTCITTFRKNEIYKDGHHPISLTFSKNILDDVKRRDFTINALYYDGNEILDFIDANNDLNNKIIKVIGDPNIRFQEDPLRMLRAVRFACSLNFKIDNNTKQAIINNAHLIESISKDKIKEEILKTISKNHCGLLTMLKETKLLDYIFPEFKITYDFPQITKFHKYDVFNHIAKASDYYSGNDYRIVIALFFHDIGKPQAHTRDDEGVDHFKKHSIYSADIAKNILKRFNFSKKDIDYIYTLIWEHDMRLQDDTYIRKINNLIIKYNSDFNFITDLLCVVNCDNHAKSDFVTKHNIQPIDNAIDYLNNIKNSNCNKLNDLCLSIQDVAKKFNISFEDAKNLLNQCLIDIFNKELNNDTNSLLRRIENEILNS